MSEFVFVKLFDSIFHNINSGLIAFRIYILLSFMQVLFVKITAYY